MLGRHGPAFSLVPNAEYTHRISVPVPAGADPNCLRLSAGTLELVPVGIDGPRGRPIGRYDRLPEMRGWKVMAKPRLVHLWAVVKLLASHPNGLRSVEIARRLGLSRPTVDRRLEALRGAGFRIAQARDRGCVRHRLRAPSKAALRPSQLQWSALLLAGSTGSPLASNELGAELVALAASAYQNPRPPDASADEATAPLRSGTTLRRGKSAIAFEPRLASAAANHPIDDERWPAQPSGEPSPRARAAASAERIAASIPEP